jgi:hypothetical protein
MNSGSVTVQEYLNTFRAAFLLLSSSRRAALVWKARAFIENHPGCADHSNFWWADKRAKCGLSARQVIEANYLHRP